MIILTNLQVRQSNRVSIVYRQVIKYQEFSWFGGPALVKGFHYFKLEKLDNGNTQLIHGEEFGWLAAFLSWLPIITVVKAKYKKADVAFKNRCETLFKSQPVAA